MDIDNGSMIVSARRRRLLGSRSLGAGRLLSSAEGVADGAVVALEVGGAGSVEEAAPEVLDACVPLGTGLPVIIIYTSRAAFSELTPGWLSM